LSLGLLRKLDAVAAFVLRPVNALLVPLLKRRVVPGSVLHISYMVHVPWHTVEVLRREGVNADYLAVGVSPYWNKADFIFQRMPLPGLSVLHEAWIFWTLVARYEIVHAHFMLGISTTGWEWPVLKKLGRRVVAHWRGCEARDMNVNMALHPVSNICQECDYRPRICQTDSARLRREAGARFGDLALVTTPDMKDFQPAARHFPFFSPDIAALPPVTSAHWPNRARFKLAHVTGHPGIEGTRHIDAVVTRLQAKGYPIDFVVLTNVTHQDALRAFADADMAIGKMKMGYYANAQIESMCLGVPTVTWVRPEFMTEGLVSSGLIFADLAALETTLEHYLTHPDELDAKRRIAREGILRLHDNKRLANELVGYYRELVSE
jgi:hypothetical protein